MLIVSSFWYQSNAEGSPCASLPPAHFSLLQKVRLALHTFLLLYPILLSLVSKLISWSGLDLDLDFLDSVFSFIAIHCEKTVIAASYFQWLQQNEDYIHGTKELTSLMGFESRVSTSIHFCGRRNYHLSWSSLNFTFCRGKE